MDINKWGNANGCCDQLCILCFIEIKLLSAVASQLPCLHPLHSASHAGLDLCELRQLQVGPSSTKLQSVCQADKIWFRGQFQLQFILATNATFTQFETPHKYGAKY